MKFFLDSADLEEIKEINSYGLLDGVTTNPTLIKRAVEKYGKIDLEAYIKKILKICRSKPVSLEIIGTSYGEIIKEARHLYKKFNSVAKNVIIKVPINVSENKRRGDSFQAIKAIQELSKEGIPINCTLIFTPEQAILSAKAGAFYASPYIGRVDDYLKEKNLLQDFGVKSGINAINKISEIFRREKVKTEILAASIRNRQHVREAFLNGAHIVTLPFKVFKEMLEHPKTFEGIKIFKRDTVLEYRKLFD
ncbi:MAG: transaldolase [Nanoarchaeota archaeon]|nr:transaldolase [Nanoarchaeota archaeon]